MKWTSAAFGVRFPDADGAAGPEPVDGAGDDAAPPGDALVHAEASAAMLATATMVDRIPLFMRSLSAAHVATRSARVKNVCRGQRLGKQTTAVYHGNRGTAIDHGMSTARPRHDHGMDTEGPRSPPLGDRGGRSTINSRTRIRTVAVPVASINRGHELDEYPRKKSNRSRPFHRALSRHAFVRGCWFLFVVVRVQSVSTAYLRHRLSHAIPRFVKKKEWA